MQSLKTFGKSVIIMSLLSLAPLAKAQVSTGFSTFGDEGTRTQLTAEEAVSVKAWVMNLQQNLTAVLAQANGLSLSDTKRIMLENIRNGVMSSQGKANETLSRYALNRGLKIADMMEAAAVPSLDQEVALLTRTTKLALKYIRSDIDFVNQSTTIAEVPFAQFGTECAELLLSINESTLDAKHQFQIGNFALGLLRKDLAEDTKHTEFDPAIHSLSLFLDKVPSAPSDADAVKWYRELRKSYHNAVTALSGTSIKNSQLSGAQAIAVGPTHACAIIQGSVLCWGSNSFGQLGNGTTADSATPVQVVNMREATAVAVGDGFSCAVAQNEVFCWGARAVSEGCCSMHRTTNTQPYLIEGLTNATALSAIDHHVCAIANAQAFCWGENLDNEFPDPKHHYDMMKNASTPIMFPGAKKVTSIAVGTDHMCLVNDHKVLCAGNGLRGGLGIGKVGGEWMRDKKGVQPTGLGSVDMIAEFGAQTCASSNGRIYCWGDGLSIPYPVGLSGASVQSSMAMRFHCTSLSGLNLCWDQNKFRSTVADASWKMDETSTQAIDAIQAIDLGVGSVSSITATPYGTCAIVSLASGNQEVHCSTPGQSLHHLTMFDHLKIQDYQATVAQIAPLTAMGKADREEREDYEFAKTRMFINYRQMTFDEYETLTDYQRKSFHEERKMMARMSHNPMNDTYQHPVGCAAKRVAKGLLLGPFAGKNDGC